MDVPRAGLKPLLRHHAYYAAQALRPNPRVLVTDVCVPISRLAECIAATRQDLSGEPYPATILGHVDDGNFHVLCVLDRQSESEFASATRLVDRMVARALAMGGTCTGEHGIGPGKLKYLEAEHGEALSVMRTIKQMLDPDNRMNPGKVIALPAWIEVCSRFGPASTSIPVNFRAGGTNSIASAHATDQSQFTPISDAGSHSGSLDMLLSDWAGT
jgi:FAD linked oxidases, C-terminal domain